MVKRFYASTTEILSVLGSQNYSFGIFQQMSGVKSYNDLNHIGGWLLSYVPEPGGNSFEKKYKT